MTAGASTTWIPDGAPVLIAAGWTTEQWLILYKVFTSDRPGAGELKRWLNDPYQGVVTEEGMTPPSPKVVLDFFSRFGRHAPHLLNAVSAGASERFTVAFLEYDPAAKNSPDTSPAVHAWQYASQLGLAEPAATGWATTNYLQTRRHPIQREWSPARGDEQTTALRQWIDIFGSDAWLWVLAGFTQDEAVELRKTGTVVTEEQLRVMVALNGVALPSGI